MRSFFEPCSIGDYIGGGIDLSREALAWLATLHTNWEGELEGVRVAMWHARPGSDMEGIEKERTGYELRRHLLKQARADVLIVGHTHVEFELVVNTLHGKILNPGPAAGKPTSTSRLDRSSCPMSSVPPRLGCSNCPR